MKNCDQNNLKSYSEIMQKFLQKTIKGGNKCCCQSRKIVTKSLFCLS